MPDAHSSGVRNSERRLPLQAREPPQYERLGARAEAVLHQSEEDRDERRRPEMKDPLKHAHALHQPNAGCGRPSVSLPPLPPPPPALGQLLSMNFRHFPISV